MTPPPPSKNACSTLTRSSRKNLSSPTLKVIHDPMPITGRRSPVAGRAFPSTVGDVAEAGRCPIGAAAPKAAIDARNARRLSSRLFRFISCSPTRAAEPGFGRSGDGPYHSRPLADGETMRSPPRVHRFTGVNVGHADRAAFFPQIDRYRHGIEPRTPDNSGRWGQRPGQYSLARFRAPYDGLARFPASTLYHKRMVRVIVFSRLLGRKRRAGDAGHRQAALTPPKGSKSDPSGGHGWSSDIVARLS